MEGFTYGNETLGNFDIRKRFRDAYFYIDMAEMVSRFRLKIEKGFDARQELLLGLRLPRSQSEGLSYIEVCANIFLTVQMWFQTALAV